MSAAGVPFVKGHGTENDFILLPDVAGRLEVTESQVRALCDRRAGIGGDGVIRIAPASSGSGQFFMDYRNADGSLAEMCGNGARLFARFLVQAGLEQPGAFDFLTRGGLRTAQLDAVGDVTIGMGPATLGAESKSVLRGAVFTGTAVDVGNPHLVCVIDGDLADLDLTEAPEYDGQLFPAGVNVEFVKVLAPNHVRLRVFERGVGETRSCGTGTVAVAAWYLASVGTGSSSVRVDVPGGSVVVAFTSTGATLTGPAELVAAGTIDQDFWDRHR